MMKPPAYPRQFDPNPSHHLKPANADPPQSGLADVFRRQDHIGGNGKTGFGVGRTEYARAGAARETKCMLVLVLELAAVALGMLTPLAPSIATGRSSTVKASSLHIAETLLDIRG